MAHYLKKSQITKVLNLSGKSFEQKLTEGLFPQPDIWLGQHLQSRRWDVQTVADHLGIPASKFSSGTAILL